MATNNYITNLSNIFKNYANSMNSSDADTVSIKKPDSLTRDIGGSFRENQPFVSGYFYIFFKIPTLNSKLEGDVNTQIAEWFHSTCEGFSPHSIMINKEDVPGIGQTGASFPTSITTNREFSLTFREYRYQPISRGIRAWTSFFNPHIGASPLSDGTFIPKNYKGQCCVIQTTPTYGGSGCDHEFTDKDIEEVYFYDGVWPTTRPDDTAAASDIQSNNFITHSITFSFDNSPLTSQSELMSVASSLISNRKFMKGFDKYYEIAKNFATITV